MLNGLIKPDGGRIEMKGRVGALIALGAGFNPILTGRENIYVNGGVLGLNKAEIDAKIDDIIDFAQLREFIDMPVQSYSSGMTVRLGFAIAVNTEPDVLLLDEVLAVGDVAFQAKCFNAIADFRRRGAAFILVTHNMHQIARYSERILYLKRGEVVYCGDRDRGVEQYLSDVNPEETDLASEKPDWSRAYGSGKVQFTGSRFLNSEGHEITTINPGDSVTLEINFMCHSVTKQSPLLDILIRDRDGIVFHGTNIMSGQQFPYPMPLSGRYLVRFPSIPSNTDYLDFFIVSLDPTTQELFDWKRHIRLLVRRLGNQSGNLDLKPSWDVVLESF
jgi:ABC-type polysaccharide/polyol phosphate transport system ATPase subunit